MYSERMKNKGPLFSVCAVSCKLKAFVSILHRKTQQCNKVNRQIISFLGIEHWSSFIPYAGLELLRNANTASMLPNHQPSFTQATEQQNEWIWT
jgi:hypothetical protein